MAKCGFGKVVINDVWEAKYPFGTDIEGRFLYAQEADRQWLLATFDVSYMFRRTSLAWRKAVSQETGIPVQNIWVHELQNHSAPIALELDGKPCEKLVEASLPVIRRIMKEAQEAELAYVLVDLGDRHNINREKYIPGLGSVTVFLGCEFDESGRAYCQDPSAMNLGGWVPDVPAFKERIYFDAPADPQGALLVFRTPRGDILGTLARFSAHSDVVGGCTWDLGRRETTDTHYHFDWPGYTRQAVDSQLGGINVCVCGPCGNLSTKKRRIPGYESGDRQAREIGTAVADELLSEWKKVKPRWEPLHLGIQAGTNVNLPLRDTLPRRREELKGTETITKEKLEAFLNAIKNGEPAYRIKQRVDEYYHWSCMNQIVDRWAALSDRELHDQIMTVELEALRLNDLVLAGLPGESMTETCQWLRAQSLGNKLIVLDQVNGYCLYQTTAEQYDQGGYSYWGSCLARNSERITRNKALEVIQEAC
ncbi:MAG: hypothetical protein WC975_04425 [Phycisphaerae bacterium]